MVLNFIFSVFVLLVVLSLLWRILTKWFLIPWPSFLAFWLENPYMKIFAHEKTVVEAMAVKPGEQVLEIGCGAARITRWLCKSTGESGFVHGLDLQASMLTQAKKKLDSLHITNCSLQTGSFLDVDYKQSSFDRVVMVTVLGEIPGTKAVLDKVHEVLKPNGVLSVCEVIPDPCYIFSKNLYAHCLNSGFVQTSLHKKLLCYIANFSKKS